MLCVRDKEIVLDVKFIFSRYDLLESKDAMSAPCLGFTWQVANVLLVPHLGTSEDGGRGAERERVNRLFRQRDVENSQGPPAGLGPLRGAAGTPRCVPVVIWPPARCPQPQAAAREPRSERGK